ncbi:MAG: polysaccharide pyruvyl transferase family protein [Faecalibacterium sp.]
MAKITLVGWFNGINYGTCVQSYALTSFLKAQGHQVSIINTYRFYYGIKHPIETIDRVFRVFAEKFKTKMAMRKKNAILSDELIQDYAVRISKNNDFAAAHSQIHQITSRAMFDNLIQNTEIFVAGSDQIWNPFHTSPPVLLAMAAKDQKKISFSSSVGVKQIPWNRRHLYEKYLSRFDFISVREKTAQQVLAPFTKKPIEVVLDPSFLLEKNDWQEIAKRPSSIKDTQEDFVFCYFVGDNTAWERDVAELSEQYHLPVYCALSESYVVPSCGTVLSQLGVQEFLWCLMNARYVVTDSFHACVLSINFNTLFVAYKRFLDSDSASQNSRIVDFLQQVDLANRLVNLENNSLLDILKRDVAFSKVNEIIQCERKNAIRFLLSALED